MDKLKNIQREVGFPICAETLEVIAECRRVLDTSLHYLKLPDKTAVILGATDGRGYMYVYLEGRISKMVRFSVANLIGLNRNSAKVVFQSENFSVTDEHNVTYDDVYAIETATISNTNVSGEKWKIYDLDEIIEPAAYENLLSLLTLSSPVSLDTDYSNILSSNDKKLRIKLKLNFSVSSNSITVLTSPGYKNQITLPITIDGACSVNAALIVNNNSRSVRAILAGNNLTIYSGEVFEELTDSIWYSQSWSVFVNSEVLL